MGQSKPKSKKNTPRRRRSPWPLVLMLGGLALVAAVIAFNLLNASSRQDETARPGAPILSIAEIQASPEAQVGDLKVDFGDMKLGAELATVRITLSNSGDKTLRFSQPPYVQLAEGC